MSVTLSWRTSSAVGRRFWFQSDGPGVGRHDVSAAVHAAGVHALVELVGHDAQVPVLHHYVAGDGGQDLLAVLVPAARTRDTEDGSEPQTPPVQHKSSERLQLVTCPSEDPR